MSNEENPEQQHGQPDPYAGWQPTPQGGEYDAEATAFVHLAPEDLANLGNDPLAAPGHGYVPPMILPLTPAAGLDPSATGSWVLQTQSQQERAAGHSTSTEPAPDAVHWPDPNQQPEPYQQPYPDTSQYGLTSSTTAQWNFTESLPPAEPEPEPVPEPAGHTGQWTIPVADGDIPEESGEFAASALAAPWYAESAPATLPGGAPAPWATQEPTPRPVHEPSVPHESGPVHEPSVSHESGSAAEEPLAGAQEAFTPAPEAQATEARPTEPFAQAPAAHTDVPEAAAETAGAPEAQEGAAEPGRAAETDTEPAEPVQEPAAGTAEPAADAGPAPETADEPAAEAGLPLSADPAPALPQDTASEHPSTSYVLHVNGVDRPVSDAWIGESLLYVLRERLGLAGAKDGCSQGECGACNVQVDGRLVASCLVPAATTAGSEVRTVEGLAVNGEPSDVQRALAECGAVQCGFCIPGMAMTVHDLLEGNHAPSELETRQALCGNLCRCSGYRGVLDAVREVVAGREATAEAAATAPEDAEPRIPHQAAPGTGGVQAPEGDVR
ncbi:2Fe-2S iron-sulfur cluster-binding protein [Streptomyces sp. NPDC002908]|uniref:2Fe-2S iron-sulfur cluster-binding protein n=1 Tax=Streptomyces sp. NPDC002908 TaxID=3364670 RepID=UPI0036822E0C